MKKEKVWYKISANKIAQEMTLEKLGLKEKPSEDSPQYRQYIDLFNRNLAEARGIKYGVESYSKMYMKERESVLGNWKKFFLEFCQKEGINIDGNVLVAGINDGQEVAFLNCQNLVGVDSSQEAINRGKNLFPKIKFFCADLCEFDSIDPGFLDTFLSLRTLHFFADAALKTVLLNAHKFLKQGGKLVVSVPGGFMDTEGKINFGQMSEGQIDTLKPQLDAKKIASFFEDCGFTKVRIVDYKIEIFVIGEKIER